MCEADLRFIVLHTAETVVDMLQWWGVKNKFDTISFTFSSKR